MASKYADLSEEEMAEKADEMQDTIHTFEKEIQKGYIGQEDVIHKILLSIVAGGNVLLEGVPGLGKSFLVETLSRVVENTEMNRIQFTPDLLPSDIVGTEAYNDEKGFYVEKGPIFANFILADEINRAPPKVQSAMLEAMQEHKVSIGDETFNLPEPFFTMATQNPVEQGGSLHPEEKLYMDGDLMEAQEALRRARKHGEPVHEDDDKTIYDVEASTNHLTTDGAIEETSCQVYEKEYDGKIYTIRTRTGRRLRVNDSHPLLVNDSGKMKWKKAGNLDEGDFLVQPDELELPENDFGSHSEAIEELSDDFTKVKPEDVEEAKEKLEAGELDAESADRLRIAARKSKKELAAEAGVSYDRALNYLQGSENGTGEKIAAALEDQYIEKSTYVESFNIHRIEGDFGHGDAGFFVGFTLAEGSVQNGQIEVSQKNYPELLKRWKKIAERQGLEVSEREKDGVPHAKIRSKPFVEYLRERFSYDNPSELLSAPEEFKKEFLEAFILSESYFENDEKEDNTRITITQQDEELVNLISYLLVEREIRPKIYEEEELFRIRISGKDLNRYLEEFRWPGDEPEVEEGSSAYRVVPVDGEMVDDVVSCLGLKNSGDMKHQDWFPTYRMAKQRGRVSEYKLQEFVESMEEILEERKRSDPDSLQEKALECGVAMTEIVEETELSKHAVWKTYEGERQEEAAEEFVEREREVRLERAESMIEYLRNLADNSVFYDPVQSIETEDHSGKVIGLSEPENHNYIAGLGACGINHNTYPLPEAQIDRFIFKIYLDYPQKHNEQKIIDMNANVMDEEDFAVNEVVSKEDIINLQEFSKAVTVEQEIKEYIVDLVDASRNPETYDMEYSQYIDWGCTPRASINLALAGRANAMYNGRHYVTPEDIRSVIHDVFIHRIILNYEGEAQGLEVADVIENIVNRVPVR